MGPSDSLVSQVGSLGSLNTLAQTASQSFAFLELSGRMINFIAWCSRFEEYIMLSVPEHVRQNMWVADEDAPRYVANCRMWA